MTRTFEISEFDNIKVSYEECPEGQAYEMFYRVLNDPEHEEIIGYILNQWGDGHYGFSSQPTKLVFDGALYPRTIKEEELAAEVGQKILDLHKKRMEAIEVLMNFEQDLDEIKNPSSLEDEEEEFAVE